MKTFARIIIVIIATALAGCAQEFVCGGYIDDKSIRPVEHPK